VSCSSILNRTRNRPEPSISRNIRVQGGPLYVMCTERVTSVRSPRLDSTSTPKLNEAYGIMGDRYIWGRIRRNPRGHDTGSVFPARASDLRVPLYLERPTLRGMIF